MQVCLVGARKISTFGDQGTADYVPLRHFDGLTECCAYLKQEKGAAPQSMLPGMPLRRPMTRPGLQAVRSWASR